MARKIISKEIVSIPEVKELMESMKTKVEETEGSFDAFQKITYNHVSDFAKVSAPVAKKIRKMLKEEYDMDDEVAVQIVNIGPLYVEELKVILKTDPMLKDMEDSEIQEIIYKLNDIKESAF